MSLKIKVNKKAIEKCLHNWVIVYECSKCRKVLGLPPRSDCRGTLASDYNQEQMWETERGME